MGILKHLLGGRAGHRGYGGHHGYDRRGGGAYGGAPQGAAVVCNGCGASQAAGGRYCSQCGVSLAPLACSQCRAAIAAGVGFCAQCGTAVAPSNQP
jgi:predicted amidophosphoribosyltransferase